jgi:HlyD family secretion protein
MKNRYIIYPVLLTLLVFACNKKTTSTNPQYKPLTEAVYASGNVYPKNEYKLIANADGYLVKQLTNEGDAVGKNQLLFQLESVSQNARLEASENIYRQSESNYSDNSPALRELEMQLRSTKTKLQNDSINYFRNKELFEKNAVTKSELDRTKYAYEGSQADFSARKSSWQRTKNSLYVDLQNSKSNFRVNARDEENFRIKAFEAGKVYEIYKKVGELVRKGDAIALIGEAGNSYIQLAIDESDFAKTKIGQEMVIKIDIYGDKIFNAKITKLYPKLNKTDQTFRADAEFVGEKPESYYGLSVEANIIISQNPKVLTIPKTYIVGGDSIWTEIDGKKQKIKIQKGVENLDLVEIKSGLNEKSLVLSSGF